MPTDMVFESDAAANAGPSVVRRNGHARGPVTAPRSFSLYVHDTPFLPHSRWQLAAKRLIDVAGAVIALVILAPLFVLIALAIKLDSAGPIFFRQKRYGRHGLRFTIFKFRSMQPDAERVLREDPELYAQFIDQDCKLTPTNDHRLTRVGTFLRKSSLDELPQFFNVLRGEMSLVGPRPIVGPELAEYGRSGNVLFTVKPGMTGYWQISGRSRIRYPERALLDVRYARDWSLAWDLKILLITIPRVIARGGAH